MTNNIWLLIRCERKLVHQGRVRNTNVEVAGLSKRAAVDIFLLCLEGESGTPRNWESQHVFRFHFRFNTAMTGMAAIDCLFKSVCPLAPCKYRSKEGRRRSPPGQMINLPDLKHCPEWDQKCGATWSNWMWWQCGIIQLQLLACTKAQGSQSLTQVSSTVNLIKLPHAINIYKYP